MFAVEKKGDKRGNSQRLIVDCRQANSLMRGPPTTRLSAPAGLAGLDFSQYSRQWLLHGRRVATGHASWHRDWRCWETVFTTSSSLELVAGSALEIQ